MKTQKTIFNVMALISALAVIAPAMAMGENLQPEILEVSAPVSTEAVLVAPVVEATVAPAVEEVVVEGSNRALMNSIGSVVDSQNGLNTRISFDRIAPTQSEIPAALDVKNPQGYMTRIGSYIKSHGGSAVYNGLSNGGLAAYNTVLENPKTSAAVALAGAGLIYGAYKYRGTLRKAVSYAFPWFGKKSTNKVVPVEKKEAPVEEAVNAEVTIGNTQPKQGTIEFNMMNRRNKKK